MKFNKLILQRCFPIAAILLLVSCATSEKMAIQPPLLPLEFSQEGSSELQEKWWLAFNDESLNQLIGMALSGNFELKSIKNRLEQAHAVARKSGAASFPRLDGSVSTSRSLSQSDDLGKVTTDISSIGIAASYELDLWGRISANTQAAESDFLASQEALNAAAISLSAEVAVTWYRLIDQQRQIELLKQQHRTDKKHLDAVTGRFRAGQITSTDLLQQRQKVEATLGEKALVESRLQQLKHQLALLSGQPLKTNISPKAEKFPQLSALPTLGIPSERLKQRPDVRQAYFQVQAADQRAAVAISERFPRISLTAKLDFDASELFNSWLSNLAANLLVPIIDGGQRKAEVDRSEAVRSEVLNRYKQTVLIALKEVEDALVQERHQQQWLNHLSQQLSLSETVVEQTRQHYIHGEMDFFRFLSAVSSHQKLQRNQLQAEGELIEYRINLYRALAGSWDVNYVRN